MMTREEAIKLLKQYQGYEPMFPDGETLKHAFDLTDETVDTLLTALRPASWEQVERVWRSYWDGFSNDYADGYEVYDEWQCRKCGFEVETDEPETLPRFCPACGAPMTDEAVQMVMERLEALYVERNDG